MDNVNVRQRFVSVYVDLEDAEIRQLVEGDSLKDGFEVENWENKSIRLVKEGIPELQEHWNSMDENDCTAFRQKHGDMISLLNTHVPDNAVKALTKLWDPSYKCFTRGSVDLTPTIEEYGCLLSSPRVLYNAYLAPAEVGRIMSEIEMLLGIEAAKARMFDDNGPIGWHWLKLKKVLRHHLSPPEASGKRVRTFTLAMYGLFLFPSHPRMISVEAADVFLQTRSAGIDPTTAILAETFLSLDNCRRKKVAIMKCCVQALFVWALSHMSVHQIFQVEKWWADPDVQAILGAPGWNEITEEKWISEFLNFPEDEICWKANWMEHSSFLAACGERPWVPLVGCTGLSAYAPTMVSRQLGYDQGIPRTHGLDTFCGEYGTKPSAAVMMMIQRDWKTHKMITKSPEDHSMVIDRDYVSWQAARAKNCRYGRILSLDGVAEDNSERAIVVSLNTQGESSRRVAGKKRKVDEDEEHTVDSVGELENMLRLMGADMTCLAETLADVKNEKSMIEKRLTELKEEHAKILEERQGDINQLSTRLTVFENELDEEKIENNSLEERIASMEEEHTEALESKQEQIDQLAAHLESQGRRLMRVIEERRYERGLKEEAYVLIDGLATMWEDARANLIRTEREASAFRRNYNQESVNWSNIQSCLANDFRLNRQELNLLKEKMSLLGREARRLREVKHGIVNQEPGFGARARVDYENGCDLLLYDLGRYDSMM